MLLFLLFFISIVSGTNYLRENAISKLECNLRHKSRSFTQFVQHNFQNKDDFYFAQKLSLELNNRGYCSISSNQTLFIGGLNEGQLANMYLSSCPGIGLFGVEIQPKLYEQVKNKYSTNSKVKILNVGIGDFPTSMLFRGEGEGAFLEESKIVRFAGSPLSSIHIPVIPLATLKDNFIYTVIDTEGYEPFVIAGMGLQHKQNRKKFPLFQFEIGGTWAVNDDRHPEGSMGLDEVFSYLHARGYLIFLMGNRGLYQMDEYFYKTAPKLNEGYGEFLAGNVLAVYPEYTPLTCFLQTLIIP